MRRTVQRTALIVMALITVEVAWADAPLWEEIKAYYKMIQKEHEPVQFVDGVHFTIPEGKELIQIMVMRHGKPLLEKKKSYTWKEAEAYINAYDTVNVEYFGTDTVCVPVGVDEVYCSNLQRSISTAQYVSTDSMKLVSDEQFRELEKKVLRIPGIKMPINFWLVTARIPWLFGIGGIEGLRGALKRAKQVAKFLDGRARQDKKTVLVAHGFLNKFLGRSLKKEGWEQVRNGGNGYLSVSVYAKLVDKKE